MKNEICNKCNQEIRKSRGFICSDIKSEDNLPFRCVHKQSYLKLDLLKYYLEIFSKAIRQKPFKHINFIDLFAGPGLCFNRNTGNFREGSSLIALNLDYPFPKYIFVDSSAETSEILRQRCINSRSDLMNRVDILNLDSNINIGDILKYLPLKSSITVAFLDPNSFDIHFNIIQMLSDYQHIDLVLNFAIHDLKRNADRYKDGISDKANLVFGCESWPNKKLKWLSFYKQRLMEVGFIYLEEDFEPTAKIKTATLADIYYLIFASKHELGLKFWREAKKKFVSGEQKDMFDST